MPKIKWKKNGRQDLINGAKYVLSNFNKRLTIKNLNTADSGRYQCTITRALTTKFPEATLTVIGKHFVRFSFLAILLKYKRLQAFSVNGVFYSFLFRASCHQSLRTTQPSASHWQFHHFDLYGYWRF